MEVNKNNLNISIPKPKPHPLLGTSYAGSGIDHEIPVSTTILDGPIPMVYGDKVVAGKCAYAYNFSGTSYYLGFVFGYGEQASITNIKINGVAYGSLTWVTSLSTHVGDGSTALSAALTGHPDWTSDDTTLWKGLCHCVMTVATADADFPGQINVTAELGGRKVAPIGGGTKAASSNPARIAYDILTDSEWAGISSTRIDTTSWEAFEDWCDESISSVDRYGYSGVITERNPDAAAAEVLKHGFAQVYIDLEGKVKLWAEMPPTGISGTWTASASTSLTGSGGSADTELSVGDRILIDSDVRTVTAVGGANSVTVDSAVTCTSETIRPITGVHIDLANWVKLPEGYDVDKATLPDYFSVRYPDATDRHTFTYKAQYGSGTDKKLEETFSGCVKTAQARRIAETKLNLLWYQPFFWKGVADGIAAQLEPGDIVEFSDGVLERQLARVLPPVVANPDGTYSLSLQYYYPSFASSNTATQVTAPSDTGNWTGSGGSTFVTRAGVETADDIVIPNGKALVGKLNPSGQVDIIQMTTGNEVVLGASGYSVSYDGDSFIIPYGNPLQAKTSGGTAYDVLQMDSSSQVTLGNGTSVICLDGYTTVKTNNLLLGNTYELRGSTTGASPVNLIKRNSSNWTEIGHNSYATELKGNYVTCTSYIVLPNNDGYRVKNTTGTGITLLTMDSSNNCKVGSTSYVTRVQGSSVRIDGYTTSLLSGEWGCYYSGGTFYMAYNNGGTIVKVALA